ncbi:MAG: hypothetical protein QM714_02830 [Nocardioides sp.]|uniref:hypothetical protein n=1 Tax=Nocardioides sp. TaxID=35761 RepID=UPI0039E5973D
MSAMAPEQEPTVIERTAPRVWREVDESGLPRATRRAVEAWVRTVCEWVGVRKPRIGFNAEDAEVAVTLRSTREIERLGLALLADYWQVGIGGGGLWLVDHPLGVGVIFRTKVGAA